MKVPNVSFNPAEYAAKYGFKVANIPLKDGSTVKVMDNMRNKVQFWHLKDGKILGAQGYQCNDAAKIANYILGMLNKLKSDVADAKDLATNVLNQLIRH